jgi:FKBP-type peptidyl-prolyl cis-trans isomerase
VQGGAFAGDTDNYRFTLGDGTVIPGLNEAISTMKEGGIRQVCPRLYTCIYKTCTVEQYSGYMQGLQ